jgi:predicted Zn finger-like uncharacterized protein
MEVHCESCPAKYAIPDEKVRGRKVRIKCKHCSAAILVDGSKLGASPSGAHTADPASQTKPSAPAPMRAAAEPAPTRAASTPDPEPPPEPAAATKPAAAAETQPKATTAAIKPKTATPIMAQSGPLKLGGLAASLRRAAVEPPPDSGSWREPAKDLAPPAAPVATTRGWREPASATPRGVKSTMLGIPAPAVIPAVAQTEAPAKAQASAPEPEQPGRSIKRTMLGIPAPAGELPIQPARSAPTPAPVTQTQPAAPAAAELDDSAEPEWTVAVTDDDHEEMTTEQVVSAYGSGRINDDTFIWAEGMDDWKTAFEIPLIAAELAARGLAGGDRGIADDERTVVAQPISQSKPPIGVWREPGNWREPARADSEQESDVSFDDVTVSMDSRKAAELLRASGAVEVLPTTDERVLESDIDDDVTRTVDSRPFLAESGLLSHLIQEARDVTPSRQDGLDFDEDPTLAVDRALVSGALDGSSLANEASSSLESAPPASEQRLTGARNEDSVLFSLDALAKSESRSSEEERVDDEILLAPPAPLPALPKIGAPSEAVARVERFDDAHPAPKSAPGEVVPAPVLPIEAPAAKRSGRGWLWLLLLLLLAGGAAAAAYHFKQPAKVFELLGIPASAGIGA